ncbi:MULTISPECIES: hypothetical protein [unclassified Leifsonia]|uniref:hypothetical protein n=1 Tax=unclassified Leifsonia TaxID=2663824 RepID=UPI0011137009|nr:MULTISPECIES: hypothetical protein [unclassified Leifsonia]
MIGEALSSTDAINVNYTEEDRICLPRGETPLATLRDLILERSTEMTDLPCVRRHPRNWEAEPIRYIGSAAIFTGRRIDEWNETRTQHRSRLLSLSTRLAGFTGHLG